MSAPRMNAPGTSSRGAARDAGHDERALTGARRLLLPMLAALALVAGFADLIRGGITLGPILLVTAYCVLIPAAILRR